MKAADIMARKVITISPKHSVKHAACVMLENHISGLPVLDDNESLVGILTGRSAAARRIGTLHGAGYG